MKESVEINRRFLEEFIERFYSKGRDMLKFQQLLFENGIFKKFSMPDRTFQHKYSVRNNRRRKIYFIPIDKSFVVIKKNMAPIGLPLNNDIYDQMFHDNKD